MSTRCVLTMQDCRNRSYLLTQLMDTCDPIHNKFCEQAKYSKMLNNHNFCSHCIRCGVH